VDHNLIDLDGMIAGMGSITELRQMLREFKSSGKFIKAYAKNYGEGGYYLASIADEVMIHPEGSIEFNGLNTNVLFLKGTFEKLGIEPQIFRVGDFKSAVEPFVREDMSDESRLQMQEMVDELNDHLMEAVAESRNLPFDEVRHISDSMLVRNPEDALSRKLVDKLVYNDEMREALKDEIDADELNLISYRGYANSFATFEQGRNRIAVVVASGEIIGGKGGWDMVGDVEFVKALREIRENENIKAVVLRVNSPGGSYLASDAIWREVKLLADEKPVIASMSDYAASGGYYISMAADTIVAHPNTITGSIGIFSILFNMKELMNKHLGMTTDGVKTGMYSDLYTSDRPLNPDEKEIIQTEVNKNYDTFIRKAAEGRSMSEEAIRKVASGRVWTGTQAVENGLVDILGDFNTAVEIAAEKAGVADDYRLRYYPPQQSFMDVLLGNSNVKTLIMQEELGTLYPYIQEMKKLERMQGVQARSPYLLEIH
jgi:protease-4